MKKVLTVLLILAMVFCMAACGNNSEEEPQTEVTVFEIGMVTDVGAINDGSFNQYTWAGCENYAKANGLNAKYYAPANGTNATDDDRIAAMQAAIDGGAKVIVTPGYLQANALDAVVPENPDVQFVFIDGRDMGFPNLVGVSYQEEQAGYLAGYAAVMEGFTKLGFSGGGGGTNPACERYGYGFAQGANDAAAKKGITVEMNYSWNFGAAFTESPELQSMLNGWFTNGTEVCFMCGGTMFNSGLGAATATDGKIIGVDVDQSVLAPDYVVTSAMKGLSVSVETALAKFFDGGACYGSQLVLGAKDDAVGLPTETWSLQNWTVEEYEALFDAIVAGDVTIDNSEVPDPTGKLANVTINFIA